MIRKGLIGSIPLLLVIAGLAAWGWFAVPPGQEVPVHWNAAGEVDRLGSRAEAFFTVPAIAVGLILLFSVAPRIDPRGRNLERSEPLWLAGWLGSLGILAIAQGAITLSAVGLLDSGGDTMPRLIGSAAALLIVVVGNALGKARPNWFAGVRTPWSLSSDRSWDITHRWAGRLFTLAGIGSLVALWTLDSRASWTTMLVLIGVASVVPVVISYFAWRADPERETFSASESD